MTKHETESESPKRKKKNDVYLSGENRADIRATQQLPKPQIQTNKHILTGHILVNI